MRTREYKSRKGRQQVESDVRLTKPSTWTASRRHNRRTPGGEGVVVVVVCRPDARARIKFRPSCRNSSPFFPLFLRSRSHEGRTFDRFSRYDKRGIVSRRRTHKSSTRTGASRRRASRERATLRRGNIGPRERVYCLWCLACGMNYLEPFVYTMHPLPLIYHLSLYIR